MGDPNNNLVRRYKPKQSNKGQEYTPILPLQQSCFGAGPTWVTKPVCKYLSCCCLQPPLAQAQGSSDSFAEECQLTILANYKLNPI